MIRALSYSQISALLRCPRAYKFRYIDNKPSVLNANLLIGRVYHQAVAAAYIRKMINDELMSEEEIADIFSNFWEKAVANKYTFGELGEPKIDVTYIEWQGVDPGELKDKGIKMCQLYCEKILPSYHPIKVEERKEADIDGIKLVGYPDAVAEVITTSSKVIIDHKWRAKSYSEKELENDFQSTVYTLLTGICDIEFHAALNQKEPKIKISTMHRTDEDVEWTKQLIKEAWGQIQSGNFPPNPMSWTCSLEQCSYFTECKMKWL